MFYFKLYYYRNKMKAKVPVKTVKLESWTSYTITLCNYMTQ